MVRSRFYQTDSRNRQCSECHWECPSFVDSVDSVGSAVPAEFPAVVEPGGRRQLLVVRSVLQSGMAGMEGVESQPNTSGYKHRIYFII